MLEEGIDFYYNEQGLMVFTAAYHLKKGVCCGNGCMHCPYDFVNVPEPKKTKLIFAKNQRILRENNTK